MEGSSLVPRSLPQDTQWGPCGFARAAASGGRSVHVSLNSYTMDYIVGQIKVSTKMLSSLPTLHLSRMPSGRSREETCLYISLHGSSHKLAQPLGHCPQVLGDLAWLAPGAGALGLCADDLLCPGAGVVSGKHRRCRWLEGAALQWGRPRQACE